MEAINMIDYIIPTVEIIEYSLEDVIASSRPKDPYDVTEPDIEKGSTTEEITSPPTPGPEVPNPDSPITDLDTW